ncbi:peptidoglycan DD-metalloendopeptidase family protein [bacterium]|nr:peptidoglycan DD-metalloendopeptidase family protein [bacterium]
MDTFQLDTLDWIRLQCAACGQTVEILRLDLEASGGASICSPCCGAKLIPLDESGSKPPGLGPQQPESQVAESPVSNSQRRDLSPVESPKCESSVSDSAAASSEFDFDFAEAPADVTGLPNEVDANRNGETRVSAPVAGATIRCAGLTISNVCVDGIEPSLDLRTNVWGDRRKNSASIAVSVVVHGILLLLLAAIVFHLPPRVATDALNASFETSTDEFAADGASTLDSAEFTTAVPLTIPSGTAGGNPAEDPAVSVVAVETVAPAAAADAGTTDFIPSIATGTSTSGAKVTANTEFGGQVGAGGTAGGGSGSSAGPASTDEWRIPTGLGFDSRRPEVRRQLAALSGATPASEAAVRAGLKWLAAHQRADGSWSLQHTHPECGDACLPNGSMDCPTAATALALLCFLGAGHSHQEGDYQQVVKHGLDWLVAQSRDGDLRMPLTLQNPEGRSGMYAHGAASMALCEAYGMTLDRTLIQPCEESIAFIAASQDPTGGGWRYTPQEPGDTSVVGWQVMALVSARLSGLEVPDGVRDKVVRFLKSVYSPSNGEFGYKGTRRATVATTAIGDLCSLYLHSTFERGDLERVARTLGAQNSRQNDEYANYYVSLVLHQLGGEHWRKWNATCRDTLVATQKQQGHARGSWDPAGRWGRTGGRLYSTSMNVLTLEVYYRHLPLYAEHAFELGLASKPTTKKRKPTGRQPRNTSGKDNVAALEFVPVTMTEPISPPADNDAVIEAGQSPLIIEPLPEQRPLFPHATRFCSPLRNLFEEATLRSVADGNGRKWRLYPDAGFGMPLLKLGERSLIHTGGDFGWFQPDEPVFAAAAGIVRYSGVPATDNADGGVSSGWGNTIVIEHQLPDGAVLMTVYAHLGIDRQAEAGDVVAAGQLIGSIGQQSRSINGDCVPHLFFAIRPGMPDGAETPLAAFAADVNDWLDPIAFLREQKADVLPAIRFSPTPNPAPVSETPVVGQPASSWSIDEWLRVPLQGEREVADMKGKTVCLVCVQSSCEASRVLGGLLLQQLAERYENSPDVVLILLQTAMIDFKQNSAAALRGTAATLPGNVAIGHCGSAKNRPLILNRYGIRATPWTILIRPDGTVAGSGIMVDGSEVGRLIDSLRNGTETTIKGGTETSQ